MTEYDEEFKQYGNMCYTLRERPGFYRIQYKPSLDSSGFKEIYIPRHCPPILLARIVRDMCKLNGDVPASTLASSLIQDLI